MANSNHDRYELRAELRRLGLVIRTRRQQLGMSIQQLAEGAMVSPAMVSLVERGLASPSLATLSAIAASLDTSMAGLFGAAEQMHGIIEDSEAPVVSTDAPSPGAAGLSGDSENSLPA
jgi:transcriptional regulator with XRE-family HTH domain